MAKPKSLILPSRETREFDMVVFGATGYTGKLIVERMAITSQTEDLKWAVAGRNKTKLADSLSLATKFTGIDVTKIPVMLADVSDEKSIVEMCRRTKLVLNCVGPYIFYGEVVVRTCIENRTDHLDLAGEPYYLESMQLKYDGEARKSEVYVIGSTGLGSLLIEAGVQFLKANFDGDVNSVDTIMDTRRPEKKDSVHFGTFESGVHVFEMASKRAKQRKLLMAKGLPKSGHPVKSKCVFYEGGKWCAPMSVLDCTSRNTEYYNYHHRNMRPAQTSMYFAHDSYLEAVVDFIAQTYIITFLALFSWGRWLLLNYCEQLTGGQMSKRGPSRKMLEATTSKFTVIGSGHSKKLKNPEEQHATAPDKRVVITIEGPDPGYIGTTICMVQAALCVLKEREKLPKKGGVLMPGAALLETTLIKRLENNGFTFKVEK